MYFLPNIISLTRNNIAKIKTEILARNVKEKEKFS